MSNGSDFNRELRYGCPVADQILSNRFFTVGYSYYFRQAKWTLEIVNPGTENLTDVERMDNFRTDFRVPKCFRADLSDYTGSGFDRGHLVPSANKNDLQIQNSETFLLSNMSPQAPAFNRDIWRKLETKVRNLDNKSSILETYVATGPIFDFSHKIEMIGKNDNNGISIPVPSHFFKCILTEGKNGKLKMWAFEMQNSHLDKEIKHYRVTTSYIEQRAGILLWANLRGPEIEKEKNKIRSMWK